MPKQYNRKKEINRSQKALNNTSTCSKESINWSSLFSLKIAWKCSNSISNSVVYSWVQKFPLQKSISIKFKQSRTIPRFLDTFYLYQLHQTITYLLKNQFAMALGHPESKEMQQSWQHSNPNSNYISLTTPK